MLKLSWSQEVIVGNAADVDYRTVRKYLAGGPVRGRGRARIERALKVAGLEHLVLPPCCDEQAS